MGRFVLALLAPVLALACASGTSDHEADRVGPRADPVLSCADVSADGVANLEDLRLVARRFGAAYPSLGYHPLYDVGDADGRVGLIDLLKAGADYDRTCPPLDRQVAQATLAVLRDPQASRLLACDEATLARRGYRQASGDVVGQGVHYLNFAYWDGVFDPARPEGLLCDDGRLVAYLSYVDGDEVGWGCWNPPDCTARPPVDGVEIDAFCAPQPPNSACSWAGAEDTWHWHHDFCITGLGTPRAATMPHLPDEACPDEDDSACPRAVPNCNLWDEDSGWMSHLWNHGAPNRHGRFADIAERQPSAR